MKRTVPLLLLLLGGWISASAQSLLMQASSGRLPYYTISQWSLTRTSILQQPFVATLDRIEVADIGYQPMPYDEYSVCLREGDGNGPVLACVRSSVISDGELGRRRAIFTNAVPVTPGARYVLELRVETYNPPPGWYDASFYLHLSTPPPAERLTLDGFTYSGVLDFGVGILAPPLMPSNASPVVYVENSPPMALGPNLMLTNQYQTNLAGAVLDFFALTPAGIDGELLPNAEERNVFVNGLHVATEKRIAPHESYRLEFTAQATPEIAQDLARRVRHFYPWENLSSGTDQFQVVFSNAVGQLVGFLPVQFVALPDAPQLRLDIRPSAVVYPASNIVVYTRRASSSVELYLDLDGSEDPDGNSLQLLLTHADDPEWSSHRSLTKTIQPGRHHFTLSTPDGETNVSLTVEFETMSVAKGLRQLKKSVRAQVSDRRTRTKLVKLLSRAQNSLDHRHPQMFYRRLYDFVQLSREHVGSNDERVESWVDQLSAMLDVVPGWSFPPYNFPAPGTTSVSHTTVLVLAPPPAHPVYSVPTP